MRFACFLVVSVLAISLTGSVRADDPQKPKDSKPADSGSKALLVGKWTPTDEKEKGTTIEYTKDGKIKITTENSTSAIDGEYKFIDNSTLDVKLAFAGEESNFKLKVSISPEEMTTQVLENGKELKKESFKRVK